MGDGRLGDWEIEGGRLRMGDRGCGGREIEDGRLGEGRGERG